MNFRLAASDLGFHVDVALQNFAGRWLAVADIAGEKEIGLGRSPREALAASLASLGPVAASGLMTDPQLNGIDGHVR